MNRSVPTTSTDIGRLTNERSRGSRPRSRNALEKIMFTPSQESETAATDKKPSPFVPARIYLSHDGRSLLHVLPDGRIVCRPIGYYRDLLARGRGESALVAVRRFFGSPAAKVAQAIVLWLLKLVLLAWFALHPGVHLTTLGSVEDSPIE
jgi:hypothetical protein